jgi:hypothetical protein
MTTAMISEIAAIILIAAVKVTKDFPPTQAAPGRAPLEASARNMPCLMCCRLLFKLDHLQPQQKWLG